LINSLAAGTCSKKKAPPAAASVGHTPRVPMQGRMKDSY
jgi:hypothetical protein